jgi:hypothetical protein
MAEIVGVCHADRDGDCSWSECPQLRDGEPVATGRHCPLDWSEDDYPEGHSPYCHRSCTHPIHDRYDHWAAASNGSSTEEQP